MVRSLSRARRRRAKLACGAVAGGHGSEPPPSWKAICARGVTPVTVLYFLFPSSDAQVIACSDNFQSRQPSMEAAPPTLITIGVSHFCEKARWALGAGALRSALR
jgi:hypothetical protein